ncbi:hypothetical protein BHM03_00059643 [Ensete ventricosum]|nr:hypothetical protein BHM03_00059643 [Ensete ventricosum]
MWYNRLKPHPSEVRESKEERGAGSLAWGARRDVSSFIIEIQDKPILEFLTPHIRYHKRYIRRPRDFSRHSQGLLEKQIDVIIMGPSFGGANTSGRKAYSQAVMEKHPHEIDGPHITFKGRETECPNHNDALVISVNVTNQLMKRVMATVNSFDPLEMTTTRTSHSSSLPSNRKSPR